jgi:hypothetical protein
MRTYERLLLSWRELNHTPGNVWVAQGREYFLPYAEVRVANVRGLTSLGKAKCEIPKGSGRHSVFNLAAASLARLTVKLRGRPTTPKRRRGPTISTGSRGANQVTRHGPSNDG